MGVNHSMTNATTGRVQGNVRHARQDINVNPTRQDIKVTPTRTSQLRGKSPLQRPSSSLSISSKASFSPYCILPPVTRRDEMSVEGSKNMNTARHTQRHDEGSVHLPDIRSSLQPIDSLLLMRKNGPRRRLRNINGGDLTQSGYNNSDLEIAVQASLANSEEQQRFVGEDNHSEYSFSELDIRTSNISERSSLQPIDSLLLMRKNGPRRRLRNINGGDLTQSGYNNSDLEIAVQASLANSEEQQRFVGEDNHSEYSFSELDIRTSNISERSSLQPIDSLLLMRKNGPRRRLRNINGGDLTQSGYNNSDLEIAVQASLANSEEQQRFVGEDNHSEYSFSELDIRTSNISERSSLQPIDSLLLMRKNGPRRRLRNINGGDLTQSGYNNSDLEIAVQASLANSEEQQRFVGEDNHSEYSFSELDIRTSNISERSSLQPIDSLLLMRKNGPRRRIRNINGGDLTQSGYNNSDLEIAVQASLANSEEQQRFVGEDNHSEYSFSELDIRTSNISERNGDFTESGYDNRDLDIALQMSLAISGELNDDEEGKNIINEERNPSNFLDEDEEGRNIFNEERNSSDFLDEEWMANESEEEQEESDDENEEEGMENCDPDTRPIEEILSEMRANFCYSGYTTLYIKRSCVWESSLGQFRQEDFSPMCEFNVKFVDDEGNEEGAFDAGGPKREYFQLVMDHLANCSLFEGPSGRKLLSYDVQANKRKEYLCAGMVIGQSLVYGGPVPRFLSPLLLDCLILGPENVTGSREDIYDPDWTQLLDEAQKTDCVRDFVSNHSKTLHIAGCLRNENMDNKNQLIQDLINYYLVERTRPAFENFLQGLHSVGVYDYIVTYPDQFRELFSKHEPLTAEKMSSMFTINKSYTDFQEEDDSDDEEREDNDRNTIADLERKTAEFWETYLRYVEAGYSEITLEDILMFATGMKEQPYGQHPKICFHHYSGSKSKYPTSSTCSCCLYLPLHETFEEFKEAMDFGILHGSQFGQI